MVGHAHNPILACQSNPSTLVGWGGQITRSGVRDQCGQHSETLSVLKTQNISWTWLRAPIIPATQEAEAGESLESRRQRFQWAEIMPLHPKLGNKRKTPSHTHKKRMDHLLSWKNNSWISDFKTGLLNNMQDASYCLNTYLAHSR